MEKINFCSAMQPKSLKEFPEERCEFCADYYRAADVDALLADVRRLVEAGKIRIDKWHNDTCSKVLIGGNESYMCDCGHEELKQAVAAVERHLSTSPPRSSPPPADTGKA